MDPRVLDGFDWIALVVAAIPAIVATLAAIGMAMPQKRPRRLVDEAKGREPRRWPRLSVIIAACDEEATIDGALVSLLAQDYPDLEIIAVDDRSRDATGDIIDRLAESDARLQALHIKELPAGWLGKVNALHQGTLRATGDFFLFCDADVHFHGPALRQAVAVALHRDRDHLAVLPELHAEGWLLRAALLGFGSGFFAMLRVDKVEDARSDASVGVGAFNLVRRRAYDRSAGMPWLKMEVADDVGLGLALKRSGARSSFYLGEGLLSLTWYPTVRALVLGLEKNLYGALCRYRLWQLFVKVPLLIVLLFAPFGAIAYPLVSLKIVGLMTLTASFFYYGTLCRLARYPLRTLFLGQLGSLIVIYALLRSAYATMRQGGILWRGTSYPIADLRAGQRVKL